MIRAADDFAAIRARMLELEQERSGGRTEDTIPRAPRPYAVSLGTGRSRRENAISEVVKRIARRPRIAD